MSKGTPKIVLKKYYLTIKKMEYEKKYPELPTAPPEEVNQAAGHSYRIRKINEIQSSLERERDKRRDLSKKYDRSVKWVNNVDAILITTSMGLGVAGVGLLSTVILAPIVVIMEGAAIGTGLLSIVGKYATKKLHLKARKHERIKILAEAKLNTISDHISKAMKDGKISAEEFSLILSEISKFQEMKENVKIKTRESIDEEAKKTLIEQGRREARESFNKYFKKSST